MTAITLLDVHSKPLRLELQLLLLKIPYSTLPQSWAMQIILTFSTLSFSMILLSLSFIGMVDLNYQGIWNHPGNTQL
jgi:short subunit fatty acids transporter